MVSFEDEQEKIKALDDGKEFMNTREYFFIQQNEKVGSQIRIISYKEHIMDPISLAYEEPNNRIITMVKRGKHIFILDEVFNAKLF